MDNFKNENKNDIPDIAFNEFQSVITQEKIFEFYEETKIFTENLNFKENSHKINKSNFMFICQNIFSSSNNKYFNDIYGLIFERLKEKKCVFTMNSTYSKNIYSLLDIISTEKIQLYVFEIFLCCIMQTEFRKKLETMFYITDADNDGLINENEIKKIVLTTNKIFCEESSEYFSGSTLIQQSLSSLKANKALDTLLYGQSELRKKFWISKYLTFEEFYDSLIKIENYKYSIIPTFINLKKCLLSKRKEIEFNMSKDYRKDFLKISYELINKSNNIIFTRNILKKCFDQKKIKKKKKVDPLKEIKAKKEREKEMKIKRMIQIKKKEFIGKKSETSSFFFKKKLVDINENENKNNNDIDYNDSKKFNISKFKILENCPFSNEDIIQNKNNFPLKKLNSLDTKRKKNNFQEKFNLIKRNSINPKINFKSLNSKKRGILRTPSNPSYFSQIDLNYNKNSTNINKFVSFSDNKEIKHSLSQKNYQEHTTTNFNLDTNFSTSEKINDMKSEDINFTNLKLIKIPLINYSKKVNIALRNSKKNKESNNNLKINVNIRNKSVLSRRNTISQKDKSEINLEKGDYYKFTSIVFPPCLINIRDKKDNYLFSEQKVPFTERLEINKNRTSKKGEIDEYDCLLKTYDEVKDEILDELEQQRNNDIHGLSAILRIEKSIEEKKNILPIVDLNKNQNENKQSIFINKK